VTEHKIGTRERQCARGQKKKKPRTDCRGQQRSEMMKEAKMLYCKERKPEKQKTEHSK